jgi:head-tail adaptor
MSNAGKYNKKIQIVEITQGQDADGFQTTTETVVLNPYASVKTTKGFTLIASGSDFEKAFINFTIRYSEKVKERYEKNNRNLQIKFNGKIYKIEYLNNVDEANVELEMQAKAVTK